MLVLDVLAKGINKAVAPKFLRAALRLHESLVASSLPLPFARNALLPLAQRLVSLEVQDEYRQLSRGKEDKSAVDNFVDTAWNVLFEDRYQRLKEGREAHVEAEAQRLLKEKEQKRRGRQKQRNVKDVSSDGDGEGVDLSERRVQALEKYIRPALLPTGGLGDMNRHLFSHHTKDDSDAQSTGTYDSFVKWIRGEYLIAKYGLTVQKAVRRHPELRDDAAGLSTFEAETEEAPLKLPSVNTVREAFEMKGWSRRKVPYSSWGEEEDNLPSGADADTLDIQQIIHHKLRGQIAHSGPLNAYFEMRRREDSYELWTRDYIFGLAQYLLDRIAETDGNPEHAETIILDVGAGDGRLCYFLRLAMKEIAKKADASPKVASVARKIHLPRIIATDDGSWRAPIYSNSRIQVEKLTAVEALAKYGPEPCAQEGHRKTRLIVICSWMPPGEDWTADFRRPVDPLSATDDDGRKAQERLVDEYIMIGEADDGTCGHNWYTWANPDFYPGDDEVGPKDAPYAMDGYKRVDLEELSLLQFSRFDCKKSNESKTVSFRYESKAR